MSRFTAGPERSLRELYVGDAERPDGRARGRRGAPRGAALAAMAAAMGAATRPSAAALLAQTPADAGAAPRCCG
jgi:sulfite oxidase